MLIYAFRKEIMKKIAIITLYDDINFGNKLQNYAVQEYVKRLGLETETLPYHEQLHPPVTLKGFIKKAIHFILYFTPYEKRRRVKLSLKEKRREYIREFSEQYIKLGPTQTYSKSLLGLAESYDYFITGSDQVWNISDRTERALDYFFLTFAGREQRLTIAPSFGFEKFPEKYIKTYKRGLEGFDRLSIREEHGAKLIRELTGQDAVVLLDPTMLVDVSVWSDILKRPSQYIDKDYILIYALGGLRDEIRESVELLAKSKDMMVIDILDKQQGYYTHTRPDEFLYWIHNAQLVVTNSFHACVFSILFNRPFMVMQRTDRRGMESRIDTLLWKFGLEDRRYERLKENLQDGSCNKNIFEINYKSVPDILEAEREKARVFYEKCFCRDGLNTTGRKE